MNDSITGIGFTQDNVFNKIVEGGQHNEKLWREAFGDAYNWLFSDYVNAIDEYQVTKTVRCYPNPVDDILSIVAGENKTFDTIQIVDMKGNTVLTIQRPDSKNIDISKLLPGTYIVKLTSEGNVSEEKFIKK